MRLFFFFSSRRRHTRFDCDWSSDVCSSDLTPASGPLGPVTTPPISLSPALPAPCVLRHAARSAARALATTPKYKVFLVFMNPPLDAAEGRYGSLIFPVRIRRSPCFSAHQNAPFRRSRQAGRGRGGPADPRYNARMLSLVFGTIAFFVASYFVRRYLNEIGIPKTLVHGLVLLLPALAAAYA